MIMEKYDIIIFMGQSNMQGQSGATTNTDIVPNAYEYRFLTNKVKPLQTPVGEDIRYDMTEGFSYTDENQDEWRKITALGSALDDCTNLIPEFCKNYTLITGRKVVAVHAAKGATTISQWLPGSGGYFAVREKVRACYNYLTSQNIGKKIVVWLQGESDAIEGVSTADYKSRLIRLKNELKKDLGIDKFAIIKVGSFTFDERDSRIFDAQEEVCKEDGDFIMLTRIADSLIHKKEYVYVWGHYNAKAQEIIGRIAGSNLGSYEMGLPFIDDTI